MMGGKFALVISVAFFILGLYAQLELSLGIVSSLFIAMGCIYFVTFLLFNLRGFTWT